MNRIRLLALCATVMITGCMPKMTIEDMKAMQPKRPGELDKLNAFVGDWEFEGEMKFEFLDEPIKTSGSSSTRWAGDNWYLIGDMVFDMGELGTMHGHETWTYDTHTKKYRQTWTDSMGSSGYGEGYYDEKTDTWYMKATSYMAFGKSTMKGHVKFLDADTMEWIWAEYAMGGLMKISEMTGTGRRQ